MITPFEIYLINLTQGIQTASLIIALISALLFISCTIFYLENKSSNWNDDKTKSEQNFFLKTGKISFVFFIIFCLILIFLPTKQTLYEMIAIPAVVNNQKVQNISVDALDAIDKRINAYLKGDGK